MLFSRVGIKLFIQIATSTILRERKIMVCDMCHQDTYTKLLIEANVKSSVYHRVLCRTCGYQTVKRMNTKKGGVH